MSNQKILLTQAGLDELRTEYDELVKVKRPHAVKRLADAKSQGDLSENSEYTAAIEDLSFIDGRIIELEEVLRQAKAVSADNCKDGVVGIGCRVTVNINGKKDMFTIVGEWEADPKEKKISHSSPLGKALVGRKKGEQIEVEAPAGKINYKILAVN